MHVELLLPGLLPELMRERDDFAAARRAAQPPSLARLLARARRRRDDHASPEAWLAEAFGLEGGLPCGALTAASESLDAARGFRMRADPVHLRLGRSGMALMPAQALSIGAGEAQALVAALNAHFGEQLRFAAATAEAWTVALAPTSAVARAPIDLAGADVDANLPSGPEATRFHALMNEVQMVLHEHPVNAAREARGEPALNSVWFWGGGTLPEAASSRWRTVTTRDPALRGLARLAGVAMRETPADAREWLAGAPPEGRALVQLESLRAPAAFGDPQAWSEALAQQERDWFAPLLAALAAGRIGMLSLQVPDAREALQAEVTRGDLRRFWRRPRPLAAY